MNSLPTTQPQQSIQQLQRTFMAITVASECTLLSVRLLRLQFTCGRAEGRYATHEHSHDYKLCPQQLESLQPKGVPLLEMRSTGCAGGTHSMRH